MKEEKQKDQAAIRSCTGEAKEDQAAIFDSEWVSLVQVVLKKGRMTVISNEKNEHIP
jgi:hypothetical protein